MNFNASMLCATCVNVSRRTNEKHKSHQTFTPKTEYEPKYTDTHKRQPNNNKMCLRNMTWWACAWAFAHLKRTNSCVCVCVVHRVEYSNAVNSIQINYHKKSNNCAIILAHKRFQMDYSIEMRMDHIIKLCATVQLCIEMYMMDAYKPPFVVPLNHRSIWWKRRTHKPRYNNKWEIPVKPIKSDSESSPSFCNL